MITVYNSVYGSWTFDNDHLRDALKMAYHFQRLGYREGVITNTVIFTDKAQYNFGLHFDAYKTSTFYLNSISTRLSNILTRKACRTVAQAVALGAGINAGFVNPWKIRDLGKQTLNELHAFNRRCVCDVAFNRVVTDSRVFLGYLLEG